VASRKHKANEEDLNKKPAKPCETFKRHLIKMQRGNEQFYQVVPDKVKNT